jgi:protoporphyrinogen oxidase
MPRVKSRRDFLKALLGVCAVGAQPAELLAASKKYGRTPVKKVTPPKPKVPAHYKLSAWTGDDFTLGHRLRSNELPPGFPEKPNKVADFVIVGGGIGGLSAAYYLNDENFLLLEQYDELGGQSRGGSYRGIDYSYGPAYVGLVDGIYGELYEKLGIKPEKLREADNAFYWNSKWWQALNSTEKDELRRHFKALNAACAPAIDQLPREDTPEAMSAAGLAAFDTMRFSQTLTGFSKEFVALLDSVCRSACCGSTGMLSAAAGYYLTEDLRSTNYCFKGGNPAIARGLVSKLRAGGDSRLQSGAFVWRIQLKENGANVFYSTSDGQTFNVECKHVIVATPPMVAWRQFANLSDKMRILLMPFKYGSYLVANMLLSKKTFKGAYDNFVGGGFSISDFTLAETPYEIAGSSRDEASVLTVYQPWEPGSAGRALLYQGDRKALSGVIHDEMEQLVGHLNDHLEEIVLTRWGHAMPIVTSGYYAQMLKIQHAYDGPYSFAHSSTQGLPSAEAAIRAGKFAANRARTATKKASALAPLAL